MLDPLAKVFIPCISLDSFMGGPYSDTHDICPFFLHIHTVGGFNYVLS